MRLAFKKPLASVAANLIAKAQSKCEPIEGIVLTTRSEVCQLYDEHIKIRDEIDKGRYDWVEWFMKHSAKENNMLLGLHVYYKEE